MTPKTTITHLVRAACRALLATPELEPQIAVSILPGSGIEIEIDVFPFDFGPVVGEKGTMKLALQSVIAAAGHPGTVRIVFANTGKTRAPQIRNQSPGREALDAFLAATLNHWRGLGFRAEGKVELSASAGIVIIDTDPRLVDAQRGPFTRIVRAIGKANGFRATTYIEKLAAA